MKFSATRYPGDGEEDQIVIRMCLKNASILLEILGAADGALRDSDGDEIATPDECIITARSFDELREALGKDVAAYTLHDNYSGNDFIDYVVCED